jgi:hypothetical protein
MAERRTSLAEAIEWLEMPIDGLDGKTLGRVAGIHLDADDGEPRWLLIRLGPLAGCTAIPVEHAAEAAERLWCGYDRDLIGKAPRFKPDESLSAAQEIELAAHWGIDEKRGRAAEVAGRDSDEITAVPAVVPSD